MRKMLPKYDYSILKSDKSAQAEVILLILSNSTLSPPQITKIIAYTLNLTQEQERHLLYHIGRRLTELEKLGKVECVKKSRRRRWYRAK
ncbi:MAG: hypothetical protein QXL94_08460 [Candidatus Parvarchaeum sp.]